MPISTKGVLVTDRKDAFEITKLVEKSLREWMKNNPDINAKASYTEFDIFTTGRQVYANIHIHEGEDSYLGHADTSKKHKRMMQICFSCDSDHYDLGKQSISFSIGQDDEGIEIIEAALKGVSGLGDTYIIRNDASCEDAEPFITNQTGTNHPSMGMA